MWRIYHTLIGLAVWLVLVPAELVRLALGRSRARHLRQRLGFPLFWQSDRREPILVHAVSVGEMAAAEAVLSDLIPLLSGRHVILTAGNLDGLAAAERISRRFEAVASVQLLPWDRARAMRRWLTRLRPAMVVVVETEIWPHLFRACAELQILLCLVNARVYPADEKRYGRARSFFREVLSYVTWFGVQSDAERRRFLDIGAPPERVSVLGNAKYDTPLADRASAGFLESDAPLLLAASTHPPEETWVLDAFETLRAENPGLRLVLAPRHVHRSRALRDQARARSRSVALWSEHPTVVEPGSILIVDELGHLPGLFPHADVVVMGGSFVPRGGHNLLEPASRGRAIVVGPHVDHFRAVVDDFLSRDAIVQLDSVAGLDDCLAGLLRDTDRRTALGARAREALEAGRGSSAATARRLAELLETHPVTQARRAI